MKRASKPINLDNPLIMLYSTFSSFSSLSFLSDFNDDDGDEKEQVQDYWVDLDQGYSEEIFHFLDRCFMCKCHIPRTCSIFMYRGDAPFCSEECRQRQIDRDDMEEKVRIIAQKMEASAWLQQRRQQQKQKQQQQLHALDKPATAAEACSNNDMTSNSNIGAPVVA